MTDDMMKVREALDWIVNSSDNHLSMVDQLERQADEHDTYHYQMLAQSLRKHLIEALAALDEGRRTPT